jgi:opacity protein-like surface antigen
MNVLRPALAALLFLGTVGATVAQAQQMPAEEEAERALQWEVTPFIGYRMEGDFDVVGATGDAELESDGSLALALNLGIDELSAYELFYSRQETSFENASLLGLSDVTVEYLHLGGTLVVSEELPLTPYIVGGLGATRFSTDSAGGSDDVRFSLSLGGGLKFPVTRNFAVRLEARGYLTIVNDQTGFFCASGSFGGVCAVQVKGQSFFQYELLAGAAFRF